ncbi:MAG: HNH endonuclease signature motif containing protein, partial [Bdellovibrionales bacterium]
PEGGTTIDLNDFNSEKECAYDGERYSVRDNGAVFRHPQPEGRKRATDNQWTFGKTNSANPYLHIASVRVHRIVATAFHGEPSDAKMVVDHIDSNARNNRPENLRWLTRLENTLLNPVTRKKIEYLCGSIEAFLENPSMLHQLNLEPDISWMRTVTPEEAQNCKIRMAIFANSGKKYHAEEIYKSNSFSSRVFKPIKKWEAGLAGEPGLDFALTPMCGQYMWRGASSFPCCPNEVGISPIESYFLNLKVGEIFSYSEQEPVFSKLTILEVSKTKDNSSILVLCGNDSPRPYAIAGISLNEEGYFIHFALGSYIKKDEADNAMRIKKELKNFWSDGYNGFR